MKAEDQNPMLIMIVEQLRDIRAEIKDVRDEIKDIRAEIRDVRDEIKHIHVKIDENYQKLDAKIDENYQHHEASIKQLNSQRITWSSTLIMLVFIGSVLANIILSRLFPFLYRVAEVESVTPIA